MATLNRFRGVRRLVVGARREYYNRVWGMDIHPTATFSTSAKLDKTFPRGVHLGERCYVALGVTILCHDFTRGIKRHTYVGRHCFVGAGAIVLPGITIGEGSIVAAGAVVTRDVPPRSVVAGSPARVIRSDIEVGPYGRLLSADRRAPAAAATLDPIEGAAVDPVVDPIGSPAAPDAVPGTTSTATSAR